MGFDIGGVLAAFLCQGSAKGLFSAGVVFACLYLPLGGWASVSGSPPLLNDNK